MTQKKMDMHLKHGLLIALEGIDGSGKSTLAYNLTNTLQAVGVDVLLTKESGGTPLGQRLHDIVQRQEVEICDKAEYLLFAADRAQHMHEVIEPALEQKKIVISDRMGDSSIAYQGYGRGLDVDMIELINNWAQNNYIPDLTIYIDIDIDTAYSRRVKRGKQEVDSIFELEQKEFMSKVIEGYRAIMKKKQHIIILDGKESADRLTSEAFEKVMTWIKEKYL